MNRTLLAAAAAGLLAVVLVVRVTSEARADTDYGSLRPTVVAARDILEGELITDDALLLESVPLNLRQPNALADALSAVDRIARVPIAAGEQVMETKLTTGTVRSVSELLPEGSRAFTMEVSGGIDPRLLRPGDMVDVIAVFESASATGAHTGAAPARSGAMKSRTILQAKLVLAVENDYPGSPVGLRLNGEERARMAAGGAYAQMTKRRVSLAVTPEEAQSLGLATETSSLYLALRGRYTDEGVGPVATLSTPDLFQESVGRRTARWSIFDQEWDVQ